MTNNFVPSHDRILVRRIEEQEKTHAGLVLPETAKEIPQEGEVLAVGSGKIGEGGQVIPVDVKKGSRVLFAQDAGTEIILEGETLLILRDDEVLGTFTDASQEMAA